MTVKQRNAVIDDYFAAIDRGDPEIVADSLDDEFVYETPGGEIEGTDAVRRYVDEIRSMSDSTHEIELRVHDGTAAAVEGSVTGEGPDGEPVSRRFVDVFEFDGETGKLARIAVYLKE